MKETKHIRIFGRINAKGDVSLHHNCDGESVTRIDDHVYPVGSDLSAMHQHPEGIVLSMEDADEIGIRFES